MNRTRFLLVSFTVLAIFTGIIWAALAPPAITTPSFSGQASYEVSRVIDGDPIVVNLQGMLEPVRLIGMDTPETGHPSKPVEAF